MPHSRNGSTKPRLGELERAVMDRLWAAPEGEARTADGRLHAGEDRLHVGVAGIAHVAERGGQVCHVTRPRAAADTSLARRR